MKKTKIFLLMSSMLLCLTSCSLIMNRTTSEPYYTKTSDATYIDSKTEYSIPDSNNPDGYLVTFDLGEGETYSNTTNYQGYVVAPENPTKSFANFEGWYYNNTLFDFNTKINYPITLTAKWSYDYANLVNYIYRNTIKACIKVETICTKGSIITRASSDSIGSGVIISEQTVNQKTYYYALTNNHVVYFDRNQYDSVSYQVYDAYSNTYSSRYVKLLYANADYDLALIRFEKDTELKVIDFAKTSKTTNVFTLGNPKSLTNAISFGEYTSTKQFTPKEETADKSNVNFDVIIHSAFLDNGSSGGGLFNFNLELVGINFASSVTESTNEFIRGYTIPIEKVREFIDLYNSIA